MTLLPQHKGDNDSRAGALLGTRCRYLAYAELAAAFPHGPPSVSQRNWRQRAYVAARRLFYSTHQVAAVQGLTQGAPRLHSGFSNRSSSVAASFASNRSQALGQVARDHGSTKKGAAVYD